MWPVVGDDPDHRFVQQSQPLHSERLQRLLALPLVYCAMTLWLRDFAYRVGSVLEFSLLSGAIVLVVVALPVGVQALKAACTNPVEALRYE